MMSDIVKRITPPETYDNKSVLIMTAGELREAAARITALEADVAAWKGIHEGAVAAMQAKVTALEAENALMRRALNSLAKYEADEDEMDWAETVLEMNAIARAALPQETQG